MFCTSTLCSKKLQLFNYSVQLIFGVWYIRVFCCSGGLAYSEWRKFRERLKILPNVFDMEKKLNQYIFVNDVRGEKAVSSKCIIIFSYHRLVQTFKHNLNIYDFKAFFKPSPSCAFCNQDLVDMCGLSG